MKLALEDIGDVCLWASSVMIIIWAVQYSILAPWWRHFMGVTIVGEALVILGIYIPSLLALADPAAFANFATTNWYLWLSFAIVVATTVFIGTRIVVWEAIRRRRRKAGLMLPSQMAVRLSELEEENARLREQVEGSVD